MVKNNRVKDIPAAGPLKRQIHENANAIPPRGRSLLKFFLLVLALSIPFWVIGAVSGLQLLPGLPVSSLMILAPLIAASILVYKEKKTAGVVELLKRSFDAKRIKKKSWYAPAVLLMPVVTALTYGFMRLAGVYPATPHFQVPGALLMTLAFFVAAAMEELGWMGYAIAPMQERWTALQAGLLLGLVWAAWHIIPLIQARRPAVWIAWWCLYTVASRILIVWIYDNTGQSVFTAILYHAIGNVSTMMFPEYFDPRITGLIIAALAAIVTIIWGPRNLARYSHT